MTHTRTQEETMSAHTPCKCAVNDGHIVSCPLHAAAPRMLAYLKQTMVQVDDNMHFIARAILRDIEGESNG